MSRERIGEIRCRACGGADLEKLYSRFSTPRSDEARLDALAGDPSMSDIDESNPSSVAKAMKRMGRELGEDFGEDFDRALEEDITAGEGDEAGDDF